MKDSSRWMRLITTDTNFNAHIWNFCLQKFRNLLDPSCEVALFAGKFLRPGRNLARSCCLRNGQPVIPLADARPQLIALGNIARRIVHYHASCERNLGWRERSVLRVHRWNIRQLPAPVTGSDFLWLNEITVVPERPLLPPGRKIDLEDRAMHRNRLLEVPRLLRHISGKLALGFVSDHAAGIGARRSYDF